MIESLHGYKQNEMANIKGQIGSRDSMGNEPESVYGMAKTEKALATVVAALEERRPGIKDRLAWPWLPLDDYAALKAAAYDAINRRTEHNMEGWEACGFLVAEWRPGHGMPWMPMSALDGLGADAAMAMRRVIEHPITIPRTADVAGKGMAGQRGRSEALGRLGHADTPWVKT